MKLRRIKEKLDLNLTWENFVYDSIMKFYGKKKKWSNLGYWNYGNEWICR